MTGPWHRDAAARDGLSHAALFYRDREQYLDRTLSFLEEGLVAGEVVQVAMPPGRLTLLRDALGDVAEQVRWMDMTEAGRNPTALIPKLLAVVDAHPGQRVRILGEPLWPGRRAVEYPACVQHEALINWAFADRDVTILCPYDTGMLDGQAIADARATHPVVHDGGAARRSGDYDPERIVADYNRPLPEPSTAVELVVDDAAALSDAREFGAGYARRIGLPAERLVDLELVVSELIANSLQHGGGTAALRVWSEDDHLVVEVRDTGRLTDPLAARRPVTPEQLAGRGLLLVNQLVDLLRMHTTDAGTTVRAHLRLPDS